MTPDERVSAASRDLARQLSIDELAYQYKILHQRSERMIRKEAAAEQLIEARVRSDVSSSILMLAAIFAGILATFVIGFSIPVIPMPVFIALGTVATTAVPLFVARIMLLRAARPSRCRRRREENNKRTSRRVG